MREAKNIQDVATHRHHEFSSDVEGFHIELDAAQPQSAQGEPDLSAFTVVISAVPAITNAAGVSEFH